MVNTEDVPRMACNPKVCTDGVIETMCPTKDRENAVFSYKLLNRPGCQITPTANSVAFRAGEATSVWSLTVSF